VRNVYTSLNMYSSLALDAFEAAGAEPILDAPPPAEPEVPSAVPESGCSIGGAQASSSQFGSLVGLAMLGIGAVLRRRRA
jgi:MYXO-CTERM domain-containing protein